MSSEMKVGSSVARKCNKKSPIFIKIAQNLVFTKPKKSQGFCQIFIKIAQNLVPSALTYKDMILQSPKSHQVFDLLL